MNGGIPAHPQHAFMAWCSVKGTETILPLPYLLRSLRKLVTNITRKDTEYLYK